MSIEKYISYQIEKQFPSIFREDGRELVELVKYYYTFLEENDRSSVYHNRRIFEYRDIDNTLNNMLLFYKNKYMKDMPLDEENTRFIIKNILDLYRRKGTNEGIELFFRLFFDTEVEIYYPSREMFKPSESSWKVGSYIQLYPVVSNDVFKDIISKKIFGSETNTVAYVDNIYFTIINQSLIPLIFVSGVRGKFTAFETIYSLNPTVEYGRVYGSMRTVTIPESGKLKSENLVGDIVDIRSNIGRGAKGRINDVSENVSGEIVYKIEDGGYGYTVSNTDIIISEQSLFLDNPNLEFKAEERIFQLNSSNTEVFGTIVGQNRISIGVKLDMSAPDANSANYVFEQGNIETLDRIVNITKEVLFSSDINNSTFAEVGSISDTEDISIITDIISDYLTVSLDSSNYSSVPPALLAMSGTRLNGVIPTITTVLSEAFVPETLTIGKIETLKNIDPGSDYFNDVFILAKENILSRFRYTNQVLRTQSTQGVIISEKDIITQTKTIEDFYGNPLVSNVIGEVVKVIGNDIYVKQKSFEPFVVTEPIFKQGSTIPITVVSRTRDSSSLQLGLNANISGTASFSQGKIENVDIIDSGFGYENGSEVSLFNITKLERLNLQLSTELAKTTPNTSIVESLQANILDLETNPSAIAIANVNSQGVTEGKWISFESHVNQEKVLQDSLFYQDYSYQIIADIEPKEYEDTYKSIMHLSGTKLFTTFGKADFINIDIDFVDTEIKAFLQADFNVITEDNNDFIISEESGSIILITKVSEV